MFRQAQIAEIDYLTDLVQECGAFMRANGVDQWLEGYPDRNYIKQDVEEGTVFVFEDQGLIKTMVVLNEKQDPEYQDIEWITPVSSKNLVVHRLATLPEFQGQGLGSRMMDFAERFAKEHQYDSIRLDTFSKNQNNLKFYEKRGYQKVGRTYLSYRDDADYLCMEKIIL
ncbi:MAG: GNAT family N-acetyltransferase [Crocinitomicaceae bacterium]|nr:GNAT family N-acetyltransferase [Crocinitomicaceae bacterium]